MNEPLDFDRVVAGHIRGEGVNAPSDAFYDELITRARRSGQRPEWLALLKESPMRTDSRLTVGSPTLRVAAILTATLLIAASIAGAGIAGSRLIAADGTLVVDRSGSGDFTTIVEAVAAAQDGDTVLIKPGRYVESVAVIGKDLIIVGDGNRDDIVIEAASTPLPLDYLHTGAAVRLVEPAGVAYAWAVLLADTRAQLSNLTVIGQQEGTAIPIVGPDSDPVLDDIVVHVPGPATGQWNSVVWTDGAGGTLRDSVVEGWVSIGPDADVEIEGNEMPSTCIVAWDAGADIVIRDNVIHGCPYEKGVDVDGANTALIEGNDIWVEDLPADANSNSYSGGRYAIEAYGAESGSITIRGNDLHDSGAGIMVSSGSPTLEITGNRIRGNDIGVARLRGTVLLSDNSITENAQIGVEILVSSAPTLEDNAITGNLVGMSIGIGATPSLTGNTICDNGTNLEWAANDEPPDTSGNEICEDGPTE
jgi:parallel beta-helix repeat protein